MLSTLPEPVDTAIVDGAADSATLFDLRAGSCGRVVRVVGDAADALRLKALGLCEGREFRVLRTGDAWVVRVLGSRIGLSPRLAAFVHVNAV